MALIDVTYNPANIRFGQRWLGSCGSYHGFAKFKSCEFGVRALLVLLRTYRFKHRLLTPLHIIERYAPQTENDTKSYVSYVCAFLKVSRTDILSEIQVPLLALAIMYFEQSKSVIVRYGIDLPFILEVMKKYNISYGNN